MPSTNTKEKKFFFKKLKYPILGLNFRTKNNYYVKNLIFFYQFFFHHFWIKGNNKVAVPNGLIETSGIKLCSYQKKYQKESKKKKKEHVTPRKEKEKTKGENKGGLAQKNNK